MNTMEDFHGKKNVYVCQGCGHAIVTVDRDAGVTPFMVKCRGGCGTGMMYSEFYRVPQDLHPTWEWYRATDDEVRAMPPGCWDHHRQGGLFLRERDIGECVKQERADIARLAAMADVQRKFLKADYRPEDLKSELVEMEKPSLSGNRHERRRAAKLAR